MTIGKRTKRTNPRLLAVVEHVRAEQPHCNMVAMGKGNLQQTQKEIREANRDLRVNLAGEDIGDEGFEILCDVLKDNNWVQKLWVSRCGFGAKGATMLGEVLKTNCSISELCMEHNLIGNEGANLVVNSLVPEVRSKLNVVAYNVVQAMNRLERKVCDQAVVEAEEAEEVEEKSSEGEDISQSVTPSTATRRGSRNRQSSLMSICSMTSMSSTASLNVFLGAPAILSVLNLQDTGIGPVWPDQLLRLTSLRTLNLSNNMLVDIPLHILTLTLLSTIDVQNNPLAPSGELPAAAFAVWSGHQERLPDPMHPGNFAMYYMGSPALGAPPDDILASMSACRLFDYIKELDGQTVKGMRNIDPRTFGARAAKLEVGPFQKRKDGRPNSEMEQAVVLQRFVREV